MVTVEVPNGIVVVKMQRFDICEYGSGWFWGKKEHPGSQQYNQQTLIEAK
jgi:hypothetical protein